MPSLIQSSFISGEWAEEDHSRTDLDAYKHALKLARNFVVMPSGGLTKRPGTRYVAAAIGFGPDDNVRLKAFGPSSTIQYTVEFSRGWIRFYRNKKPVLLSGSPLTLASPYAAADLARLSFTKTGPTQTATALLIWHQNYAPHALEWVGGDTPDTSWQLLSTNLFVDGPYLDQIGATTTATPGAALQTTTITLNNTTEVNNGLGFVASDVGRVVRFLCPTWQLAKISIGTPNGSGYNVGDTINPAGGTPLLTPIPGETRQAVLTVTQAPTGAVTGLQITDPGQYLLPPPGAFTQDYTNGVGAGLTGAYTYEQSGRPVWIWGIIEIVNSSTSASVSIQPLWISPVGGMVRTQPGTFLSTAPITTWRMGAWCETEGFPSCAAIFQGRLVASGQSSKPKRVWGSETNSFGSYAPTLSNNGQVVDSNGFTYDLNDNQSDMIEWLMAAGKVQIPQLAAAAADGEFVIKPSDASQALGPLNVQAYQETRYGSSPVQPLAIGRLLIFLERASKRLWSWLYQWMVGGFLGNVVAPHARHIFLSGWSEMDYAQVPFPIIWGCDAKGGLFGLTFQQDQTDQSRNFDAAHSHQLGGSYYGGPPIVESLTVQRSEDGTDDQLWLSVLRNDNGTPQRTIEVMDSYFRDKPLDQAVFTDCAHSSALTFPVATCIPGPGPFSPSGNKLLPARGDSCGFLFGASVALPGDLVPGTVLRVNGGSFSVHTILGPTGVVALCIDPPSSLTLSPSQSWSYTKMLTSTSGFDALNGHTVRVLSDGADEGLQLVSGGLVLTSVAGSYITAGLDYVSETQTLDLDLPALDGTSQMKTGRLDQLYLRVFQSLGGQYGAVPDLERPDPVLDTIEPRRSDDLIDWPPPLVTEDLRVAFPAGSSMHRRVRVFHNMPWPLTLLALVVKGGTTEAAPR